MNGQSKSPRLSKTPILTELLLLNSDDDSLLMPYVVDLSDNLDEVETGSNKKCLIKIENDEIESTSARDLNSASEMYSKFERIKRLALFDFLHFSTPSKNLNDYFVIQPDETKYLEDDGIGNSLFLSVARSLLYKLHYVDNKYEYILRNLCLDDKNCLSSHQTLKFDSDMNLQLLLRRKLCLYWLSHVENGDFKDAKSKYARTFDSVYEFIYQIFQNSINNYSKNVLFKKFALDDLADLLDVQIITFEVTNNKEDLFEFKQYNPTNSHLYTEKFGLSDYIFLRAICSDDISKEANVNEDRLRTLHFKWLMPIHYKQFIYENLLSTTSQTSSQFINLTRLYPHQILVLNGSCLYNCFSIKLLAANMCLILFLKFLNEVSVHTLITLKNTTFMNSLIRLNDIKNMLDYLNGLWGQKHFYMEDLMGLQSQYQIQYKKERNEAQTKMQKQLEMFSSIINYANKNNGVDTKRPPALAPTFQTNLFLKDFLTKLSYSNSNQSNASQNGENNLLLPKRHVSTCSLPTFLMSPINADSHLTSPVDLSTQKRKSAPFIDDNKYGSNLKRACPYLDADLNDLDDKEFNSDNSTSSDSNAVNDKRPILTQLVNNIGDEHLI